MVTTLVLGLMVLSQAIFWAGILISLGVIVAAIVLLRWFIQWCWEWWVSWRNSKKANGEEIGGGR